MTFGGSGLRSAVIAVLLATGTAGAIALPRPAHAAEPTEARLKRLEDQLRAVQRKVFPDGAGRILAPEIAPPAGGGPALPAPSNSAMTDLLTRLDTVEAQIRRLTAQGEDNQNRLGKLEAKLAAMETAQAAPPAPAAAAPATPLVDTSRPARDKPAAAGTRKPKAATAPSADRLAAVQAIVKPQTGDAGEDDYLYGYELWNAKFYPEAQQALQGFVDKYPRHKRMSYARNLLGRAFLDEGQPGSAAQWFVQNYQSDKKGERAPDSLLYLAVAMERLKETKRACVALTELRTNFPDAVAGRLKGDYARTKTEGGCN